MESSKMPRGKPATQSMPFVAATTSSIDLHADGLNGDRRRTRAVSLPAPRVFSQMTSPNTNRFLKNGAAIVGEAGVRKMEHGNVPSAREIRAEAITSDLTHKGAGLHEIVPTNLKAEIATLADKKIRSIAANGQSGLRTSTALTPLRSLDRKASIGGHTGTFLASPSSKASSVCLTGQKQAHDVLRSAYRNAVELDDLQASEFLVLMSNAQLSVMPPGIDVIHEPGLRDVFPNIIFSKGQAVGPVPGSEDSASTGVQQDFVKVYDVRRETFKDRTRAVKRSIDRDVPRVPSPSPERKAFDGSPGSGNRVQGQTPRPLPQVPAVAADFPVAQLAAWMTEPMRLGRSLRSSVP